MKLVFVPLKDVFKECKGKRQFSIKKDAYRRFSSVSNEMQIGIKKIAALYAVADSCAVSIDRRLTWGETWEGALDEIRALPAVQKANAVVSMYNYDRPSWTGLVYPTECYFPTWKVEEDHFTVKALVNAYEGLFGKAPVVDKWTFSTNGVSIMGRHGIPVIGFGPGKEPEAHAPNEKTWKSHLVTCAAMYAAIPLSWLATE